MRADKVKGLVDKKKDIPIAIKKKTAKEMTGKDVYDCGKIAGANATRSTIGSKELVLDEGKMAQIINEVKTTIRQQPKESSLGSNTYIIKDPKAIAKAISSRIEDVLKVKGE